MKILTNPHSYLLNNRSIYLKPNNEHNYLINFYLIIMVIICKFVNGFG